MKSSIFGARLSAWRSFAASMPVLVAPGKVEALDVSITAVPGEPSVLLGTYDISALDYEVEEFFVSGSANTYALDGPAPHDGCWEAEPVDAAPYKIRIVVIKPVDPARFNGTVVVEWMNVSGGVEVPVDWNATHREVVRGGYAYVAVSAQKLGVEGGVAVLGAYGVGLKSSDPERYGTLSHPGDAYSYDIFSQVGQVLAGAGADRVLGSLAPRQLLAIGESQSATFLTTYLNAIDPVTPVYDGFLIHSRFGQVAALDGRPMRSPDAPLLVARFRADLRVPVLSVITETDLLDSRLAGYHRARRPDGDRVRVWEVAGTAHADNYTFMLGFIDSGLLPLEELAAGFEPTTCTPVGDDFDRPINFAPQHHYVVQAALSGLERWVRTGTAPQKAEPIALGRGGEAGDPVHILRDAHGIAQGGLRTPWVDVPTARLSGMGNSGNPQAFLVGVGEPFDAETLGRLYPGGRRDYLEKFEAALDGAIAQGFLLSEDRDEILGVAAVNFRGKP